MDNIRPIRNDDDLEWAIAEVSAYFDNQPEPGTPEADRFDLLSDLIESYENKHHPIDEPDPIDLLNAVMAARGYSGADLSRLLGSRSRSSEILNRQRALNLGMIRKISKAWHIPAGALVEPYHLDR